MPRFSTISDNNSSTIISNFKDIFDRFNFVKIAKKLRIEISKTFTDRRTKV